MVMSNTPSNNVVDRDQIIRDLKAHIEAQDEYIQKLNEQPAMYTTVAAVGKGADGIEKIIVVGGGGFIEVEKPNFPVKVGDTVATIGQTGQVLKTGIIQIAKDAVRVKSVKSPTEVEIEGGMTGGKYHALKDPSLSLEEGDLVSLDHTGLVVVRKLESAAKKYVKQSTGVTWDDIGGLEEAKEMLIEAIELPLKEPEIFQYYGYKSPKGLLLSGPPGCGKTMLGKATATAIATIYGGDSGFIYVKGPEILNKFVGESEKGIRDIFDQARAHKRKTGSPAVVFIDEAEAILSRRGTGLVSDMEKTIVPAFLAEMDGLEETAAIVMLATNRPDQLDPAVIRDGRIDRKIPVTRPREAGIEQIACLNLQKVPTVGKPDELAKVVSSELLSKDRQFYVIHTANGDRVFTMADVVSGAMVANVVDRARSIALQRDRKDKTRTGVGKEDLVAAVNLIETEMVGSKVDHRDEILEALDGEPATGVTQVKRPKLQVVA